MSVEMGPAVVVLSEMGPTEVVLSGEPVPTAPVLSGYCVVDTSGPPVARPVVGASVVVVAGTPP